MLSLSLPFRCFGRSRQQPAILLHQFRAKRDGATINRIKVFGAQAPGKISTFVVSIKDLGGYIFALEEGCSPFGKPPRQSHPENPKVGAREIAPVAYQISRSEAGKHHREGYRADRERRAAPSSLEPG